MCRIDPRIELPGILLVFLTGVSFFFFFFFFTGVSYRERNLVSHTMKEKEKMTHSFTQYYLYYQIF